MSRFDDEVDFIRGDLVYGLRDARTAYSRYSNKYTQCTGTIIDEYNNALFADERDFKDRDTLKAKIEGGLNQATSSESGAASNLSKIEAFRTTKPQIFEKKLIEASDAAKTLKTVSWGKVMLQDTNRFGPLTVFGLNQAAMTSKNNTGSDQGDRWYAALRKACKLGIGFATHTQYQGFKSAKIHFLLDGLDLESVAKKTPTPGSDGRLRISITCSELRYTFRNWNALTDKVLFYVSGETVLAPWLGDFQVEDVFKKTLTNKKAWWEAYAVQRSTKYGGVIPTKAMPGTQ